MRFSTTRKPFSSKSRNCAALNMWFSTDRPWSPLSASGGVISISNRRHVANHPDKAMS